MSNSYDVLTAYFQTEMLTVKKQQPDKELILDVSINDSEQEIDKFIELLINLYNANTEKEQIDVF